MTRNDGWRFLSIGRHLERLSFVATTLDEVAVEGAAAEPALLDWLLDLSDSLITYRSRHMHAPEWQGVLDLLLFDGQNPRSALFQLAKLDKHVQLLPGGESGELGAHARRHCPPAGGLPSARRRAAGAVSHRRAARRPARRLSADRRSGSRMRWPCGTSATSTSVHFRRWSSDGGGSVSGRPRNAVHALGACIDIAARRVPEAAYARTPADTLARAQRRSCPRRRDGAHRQLRQPRAPLRDPQSVRTSCGS